MLPCRARQPAMPGQLPWVPRSLMAHQQCSEPARCCDLPFGTSTTSACSAAATKAQALQHVCLNWHIRT